MNTQSPGGKRVIKPFWSPLAAGIALGLVLMLKGANSSKVIGDVKERVAQIEKTLPEGVVWAVS